MSVVVVIVIVVVVIVVFRAYTRQASLPRNATATIPVVTTTQNPAFNPSAGYSPAGNMAPPMYPATAYPTTTTGYSDPPPPYTSQ